jgi:hypothetical protein
MSFVALSRARRRRLTGTPLLRFLPLQRLPARDALSVAAVLRTIPLRRSDRLSTRASADRSKASRRPCGFSLCECDAVKLDDGRCCLLRASGDAPHDAAVKRASQCQTATSDRPCSWTRRRIRLCWSHAQAIRSSSATASLIRRIAPVMHRRFAWGDVPLPTPTHRGLAESLVLPSDDSAALMGFSVYPSQVCSRIRVADHF